MLAEDPDTLQEAVRWLEETEGVAGLEVGLPPDCSPIIAADLAESAVGELPVILRLPFEHAGMLARALTGSPIAGVSLSPPRGVMLAPDGSLVRGRLYGPGIFPQTLYLVQELVQTNVPIVAGGGIYRSAQIQTLLAAGVQAVQLDAVLWRGGMAADLLKNLRAEFS